MLPHRRHKVLSQPGKDYAGDLGGDDVAGLTGLLEIAAEEEFATLANDKFPELTAEIQALVEPESQADSKFQTPLAYTRMTAKAVREQLLAKASQTPRAVPAERTLYDHLNRLGYRLRRVRKTKPQKNSRDRRDLRESPAGSYAGRG